MRTIKSKIITPFLILITVLPLLTLLLFNITMKIYVNKTARAELTNTIKEVNAVVKNELFTTLFETDKQVIDNALLNIKGAIVASKFAPNSELLLFNNDLQLIYPQNTESTDINEAFISAVLAQKDSFDLSKILKIKVNNNDYLIVGYKLTKLPISDVPFIVFAHSLNAADGIIRFINVTLLGIMLLGIVIGIFISNIISNRIAKPLKDLCSTTDAIGSGDFINVTEKSNVSELARLYSSINTMSAKLQAYDHAQRSFLQNASHELRTPLMSIQGYAEGIENGVLTDVQKAASIISSESKRVNALVDQLLTISRIENQTYTKELKKLNINDMLKEYVQRINGLALREEIKLQLQLPKDELFIKSDENLLGQAVINIASNCLRYAASHVCITLSADESNAVITMQDDGIGISPEDLPHIFERFYKGKGGNFGLGLAIAKSAIAFMNGHISVENNAIGAKFSIIIPLFVSVGI